MASKKNNRMACVLGRYTAQSMTSLYWHNIDELKEMDEEDLRDSVQEDMDNMVIDLEGSDKFKNIERELASLGTPDMRPIEDDIWDSFLRGFNGEQYKQLHKQGIHPWGKDYDILEDCNL